MYIYMAPLEGITGYIFRNTYSEIYKGVDKYFTPFIVPAKKRDLKTREKKDIHPDNNKINVVPQILTNKSDEFISVAKRLMEYGYKEINLNAGCPSGTVFTKYKGSGMLRDTEQLKQFLDEISNIDMKISVKTRIGVENVEEFYEILDIYNQFDLYELIIHPRVREDYYNNSPNIDMFKYAYDNSKNPVIYNGDIFLKQDYELIESKFENINAVMLGRGILKRPDLPEYLCSDITYERTDFKRLRKFHDTLIHRYSEEMQSEMNAMFKMKELWVYMIENFIEGMEHDALNLRNAQKLYKKIRKTRDFREYMSYTSQLFDNYSV